MKNFNIVKVSTEILKILTEQAIVEGSLNIYFSNDFVLTKIDGLENNELMVCLEYMYSANLLIWQSNNDGIRNIIITSKAIELIQA